MKLILAYIAVRRGTKNPEAEQLVEHYLKRAARYSPAAGQQFDSEAAFIASLMQAARTRSHVVLLDARGQLLSSEALADLVRRVRDAGTQQLLFAVGPADGWSEAARARADMVLSLGPMTLPHELARVVLAEQVYRALTILAGHPYHSGH